MKKTKESIELKRKKVYEAAYSKAMWERKKKVEDEKERNQNNLDRKIAQIDRKIMAKLKRKKEDCDKKMNNEIRKLEGKPEREYKVKKKKLNKLEFAMEIAQENAKLRDTDEYGRGFCISCDGIKERGELAGGHYISRRVKNICLHPANINAQCHSCNFKMGPQGSVELKYLTEQHYRDNLIRKVGPDAVKYIEAQKVAYFQKGYETNGDYGQGKIDLDNFIDQLILENEARWYKKGFYSPRENWKRIWEKYKS